MRYLLALILLCGSALGQSKSCTLSHPGESTSGFICIDGKSVPAAKACPKKLPDIKSAFAFICTEGKWTPITADQSIEFCKKNGPCSVQMPPLQPSQKVTDGVTGAAVVPAPFSEFRESQKLEARLAALEKRIQMLENHSLPYPASIRCTGDGAEATCIDTYREPKKK